MNDNHNLTFPKTLLIVCGNYQGGGQIFLRDALQHLPRECLIRYSFIQDNQISLGGDWNGFQNIIRVHPPETPLDAFKFKGRRLLYKPLFVALYLMNRLVVCAREAALIQEVVAEANIQRVLVVLNSPFMINLAAELIKRGNRVYAIVWDPPERFIEGLLLPKFPARLLLHDFETVIRKCSVLGTASEGMRVEYSNIYNKNSIVLIHSLPVELFAKTKNKLFVLKRFTIGFAGNLYATTEWEAFIRALNSVDWIIAGHKVSIEFLGNDLQIHQSNPNTQITFWGWRGLKETVELLCKTDVGYLPYWIDSKYGYTTRMTFPNKISVYLAAGIPILYHGPVHGTPVQFLSNYPVGVGCYSTDLDEIIKNLEIFVTDKKYFSISAKYINKARLEEYNLDRFRLNFKNLLSQD